MVKVNKIKAICIKDYDTKLPSRKRFHFKVGENALVSIPENEIRLFIARQFYIIISKEDYNEYFADFSEYRENRINEILNG